MSECHRAEQHRSVITENNERIALHQLIMTLDRELFSKSAAEKYNP
jgi:hypothetical protein